MDAIEKATLFKAIESAVIPLIGPGLFLGREGRIKSAA